MKTVRKKRSKFLDNLAAKISKMDDGPESIFKQVEMWCEYPMNFLSLEELNLGEPDIFYSKIDPLTWPDDFNVMAEPNNIEFTSLGKFYLMSFMGTPESYYPNIIATFLFKSIYDFERVMYGDIIVISSETFRKITA